jgi:hypothetical protein
MCSQPGKMEVIDAFSLLSVVARPAGRVSVAPGDAEHVVQEPKVPRLVDS